MFGSESLIITIRRSEFRSVPVNDYSKNQHKLLGTVICSVDTGIVNVRHRQIKAANVKETNSKENVYRTSTAS